MSCTLSLWAASGLQKVGLYQYTIFLCLFCWRVLKQKWAVGSCPEHCVCSCLSHWTWAPSLPTSPSAGTELYHTIQANYTPVCCMSGEVGLAVGLGLGRNNLKVLHSVELYVMLPLLYSLLEQVRESTVTSVEKEGESWCQVEYMPSTSTPNRWKMDGFKPGSLHT